MIWSYISTASIGYLHYISRVVSLPFNKSFSGWSRMNPSWTPPQPANVGDSLADVQTPALIVEVDYLERNMMQMSKIMGKYPHVAVRPHVKAHKAPAIGKLQVCHLPSQCLVYGLHSHCSYAVPKLSTL